MTTGSHRFCGTVHPDDVGLAVAVRVCVLAAGHPDDLDHLDPGGRPFGRRTSAIAAAADAAHPIRSLPDYTARRDAARRVAAYQLGDMSWADMILDGFADPDRVDADGEVTR